MQGIWHRSQLRSVLALVMALVGFTGMSPAPAAFAAAVSQPNHVNADAPGLRMQSEVKLLDRYVVTSPDGTLALTPPSNVVSHVDPGDMALFRSGLATVNAKISAGELVVGANHNLADPTATGFNIQWNWTGRKWFWWGEQDWFSEYWTLKIEAAYNMGAAATTICAIIAAALGAAPVALLCGIAAAVLAFGAAWMQWADNGGGVVISQTWTPFPIGGIWISGQ